MNSNMHKNNNKKIDLGNSSIYSDDLALHNWSNINKHISCQSVRSYDIF